MLPITFVVRVGILFLWLSSFRFVEGLLSFSRAWFPSLYCFFMLLSFEGLDSWKDNVWIWFCHGILFSPSMVIESLAGYSSLSWHLCSLRICMTSDQHLMSFVASVEKSVRILRVPPLYVTWLFSLAAFNILSFFCEFSVLIIMLQIYFLYWSHLFGVL